jgi:hypothetical protein
MRCNAAGFIEFSIINKVTKGAPIDLTCLENIINDPNISDSEKDQLSDLKASMERLFGGNLLHNNMYAVLLNSTCSRQIKGGVTEVVFAGELESLINAVNDYLVNGPLKDQNFGQDEINNAIKAVMNDQNYIKKYNLNDMLCRKDNVIELMSLAMQGKDLGIASYGNDAKLTGMGL